MLNALVVIGTILATLGLICADRRSKTQAVSDQWGSFHRFLLNTPFGVLLTAMLMTGACDACDDAQKTDPKIAPYVEQENAKADLRKNPSKYITGKGVHSVDSGIINKYTRATQIEFTNKSRFDVSDIQGTITFFDTAKQKMATMPFVAPGSVYADQTKYLDVSSGEISGAADTAEVAVEKVHVAQ